MKRISLLVLIIAFASQFGITQIFAQKKSKLREVIIIEFTTPSNAILKREVLINRTSKIKSWIGSGVENGIGVGCSHCDKKKLEEINRKAREKFKKESYSFTASAWKTGKNKSNLNFDVSIGDGNCYTKKIITIHRNKITNVQLNCGLSLVAYYGFESEEVN